MLGAAQLANLVGGSFSSFRVPELRSTEFRNPDASWTLSPPKCDPLGGIPLEVRALLAPVFCFAQHDRSALM